MNKDKVKILLGGREKNKFFFFKHKTAYDIEVCDWSSDVCSSDLFSRADTHY